MGTSGHLKPGIWSYRDEEELHECDKSLGFCEYSPNPSQAKLLPKYQEESF